MVVWKRAEVSASNPVRSSDVRKLRQELQIQYGDWIRDEDVEALLPASKSTNFTLAKVSSPKATVYLVDGEPILFQLSKSDALLPTVYALWRVPHWPCLETIGEVSKFLLSGADLMGPGVFRDGGVDEWDEHQVRAVRVRGNRYPFAVGHTACSSRSLRSTEKGKALVVEHLVGDALWELGSRALPNDGFRLGEAILPAEEEEEEESTPAGDDDAPVAAAAAAPDATADGDGDEAMEALAESLPSKTDLTEATPSSTDMSPDELLLHCFLQALTTHPEVPLPMDASKFYMECVVPARPPGTTLDVKATSYKKLGGFLKAMAKQKLIKIKDQRGVILLAEVDRSHELLRSFQPSRQSAADAATAAARDNGNGAATSAIRVREWLKPRAAQQALFQQAPDPERTAEAPAGMYTAEEVAHIVEQYVRQHGLGGGQSGTVRIDEVLRESVRRSSGTPPDELSWAELKRAVADAMEVHHCIGEGGRLHRGRAEPVRIIVEDRQGGRKHVTRIQRVSAYGIDDQAFATEAQRKFAAAATVAEIPGSAKKGGTAATEVVIQGAFGEEMHEFLCREYGVPRQWCDVSDKRKKRVK